jgi:ubiquinone/menaquinone biosynthesis C-methylase UbiE
MPYLKKIFDVSNLDQAKDIVLTGSSENPEKFTVETEFLINTIANQHIVNAESTVLDFGCGMGRVSKKVIDTFNCNVIGVDISNSMKMFANLYVDSAKFKTPVASYTLPNSIDVCISTFVLQHVQNPQEEIDLICNVLKPGGYMVVVNEPIRHVPSGIDNDRYVIWEHDNFDIFRALESKLTKVFSVPYMSTHVDVIFYQKPHNTLTR